MTGHGDRGGWMAVRKTTNQTNTESGSNLCPPPDHYCIITSSQPMLLFSSLISWPSRFLLWSLSLSICLHKSFFSFTTCSTINTHTFSRGRTHTAKTPAHQTLHKVMEAFIQMAMSSGSGLPEELLFLVRGSREDWSLYGLSLSLLFTAANHLFPPSSLFALHLSSHSYSSAQRSSLLLVVKNPLRLRPVLLRLITLHLSVRNQWSKLCPAEGWSPCRGQWAQVFGPLTGRGTRSQLLLDHARHTKVKGLVFHLQPRFTLKSSCGNCFEELVEKIKKKNFIEQSQHKIY